MKELFSAAAILLAASTQAGVMPEIILDEVASFGGVTHITNAGDSRLFVVLQEGVINVLNPETGDSETFLDISSLTNPGGERGLLSVAFHPNYQENGWFFVNYTDTSGDTVIARYEVSADPDTADAGSARVLLNIEQDFSNHNGGQLAFGPDGMLYIGMGDGGSGGDPNCRAQNMDTLLGKMLRIDVDVQNAPYYQVPPDNPFVGAGDPPDEIWASGLRNPWRFSFDRQTGDLWIGDVGQGEFEEINFAPASSPGGENYGWRIMEGFSCFSSSSNNCNETPIPCNSDLLTDPVVDYDHSNGRCSVTGGFVYRGQSAPDLRGLYIFSDFCGGDIMAIDPADPLQIMILGDTFGNVRTFGEAANGDLYVEVNGTIYEIRQDLPPSTPNLTPVLAVEASSSDDSGEPVSFIYRWESDGGDEPVVIGPTQESTAMLREGDNGATFEAGERWTLTVTAIDSEGNESPVREAAFLIEAGGVTRFEGWVLN